MTFRTERRFPQENYVGGKWRDLLTWHDRSLVVSTALRVLLFGLIVSLTFAMAGMSLVQRQESKRIAENIADSISTVESTVRVACFTGDAELAKEAVSGLMSNHAIASVRVDSGNTVLADSGKFAGKPYPAHAMVVSRKITSPFNDADQVGEVAVVADDDYIRSKAVDYSVYIGAISLLEMLAVCVVVSVVVLRTVVRPIRQFSGQLRVSDIDSEARIVPPPGSETNEIGHLAYSFNNLLDGQRMLLHSEQALRIEIAHKEGHFRALAENSPNMLVRYDAGLRRVYCNPAYDFNLGLSKGGAYNLKPEQLWLISNLSATEYQAILEKVMASGVAETVLLEWSKTDGHRVVNDFHLVPELGEDGEVSSVLAIGHDISQLKKQQQLDLDRSQVFERIVQGGEIADVLCMVAEYVERAMPGYWCGILLREELSDRVQAVAAPSMPQGFVAEAGRMLGGLDEAREFWGSYSDLAGRHGMGLCRHERVLNSRDKELGMLVLHRRLNAPDSEIDMSFVRQACSLAAIAIERKRSEELIRHQASYDALTDLPNRRMFVDRLREEVSRAGRNQGNVTLMFIDLDRFKGVNDTLGHEVGDELLVNAALRIRRCVRESDLVARLGGDEFVVLIPNVTEPSQLGRLAKDITASLSEPFRLDPHIAYVSASIGIAGYPNDADSPDRLVSCADQAMYAAKEAGRNGFHFYSAELSEAAHERLELEVDLRHAMHHGELELYYQPKVALRDGALVGSEALLRWHHPRRGMVSPDKFIRVAEDCGLIMELGEWVLRDACRQARMWNAEGRPPHQVAVNLSPRQFQGGHLYELVCGILDECNCPAEWIELEITESLLLEEGGEVLETLNRFRDKGISIAIDDFGTGYSALSYLARFPINTLKIDRSFVRHIVENGYHAEVIKAILSIAHSLGQQVVAEGVETPEQADLLRRYGCHVAQGFLYGKPMSTTTFAAVVMQSADGAVNWWEETCT